MNQTKIRNKKEIGDSILRGLNEALEFVKGEKKECRIERKEKRSFPRNSQKALNSNKR